MTINDRDQARMKEFQCQKHMNIEIEEDVLQAMAIHRLFSRKRRLPA